jgi:hypothetical protein
MGKTIGKSGDLERPSISASERINNLLSEAQGQRKAGVNLVLGSALTQVKRARIMRQVGDRFADNALREAAELNEKAGNPIDAVMLYAELNDIKSMKRIAAKAATQLGDTPSGLELYALLNKFPDLKDGTEDEARAMKALKSYLPYFGALAGFNIYMRGRGRDLLPDRRTVSASEIISNLGSESFEQSKKGLNLIQDSAKTLTVAARLMQREGFKLDALHVLKEAAEAYEIAGNLMAAVLLRIEANDITNTKRIAQAASNKYGPESSIGFALGKFARLDEGSEESENAFVRLKTLASEENWRNIILWGIIHKNVA